MIIPGKFSFIAAELNIKCSLLGLFKFIIQQNEPLNNWR